LHDARHTGKEASAGGEGHWRDRARHALVVMHDWKQQKKLEAAIRSLVRLAVERATLEGYQQGYNDGKRRAVNGAALPAEPTPPSPHRARLR